MSRLQPIAVGSMALKGIRPRPTAPVRTKCRVWAVGATERAPGLGPALCLPGPVPGWERFSAASLSQWIVWSTEDRPLESCQDPLAVCRGGHRGGAAAACGCPLGSSHHVLPLVTEWAAA